MFLGLGSLVFPFVRGGGAARNFFIASSYSVFHPPLALAFFFRYSSSLAFLTSLLTQSSHLSLALPRLLLLSSRNSAALVGGLSSAILSRPTCPAHVLHFIYYACGHPDSGRMAVMVSQAETIVLQITSCYFCYMYTLPNKDFLLETRSTR